MVARLTGAAMSGLAMSTTPTTPTMLTTLTTLFVLTMLFTTTGTATTSRPTLRRAIGWPHPLGLHPVDDPVELFDDLIQTTGSVAPFGSPVIRRPLFSRSHKMHSAGNDGKHRHTPRHSQPFQCPVHCMVSF
jgi:hypothetical protein